MKLQVTAERRYSNLILNLILLLLLLRLMLRLFPKNIQRPVFLNIDNWQFKI